MEPVDPTAGGLSARRFARREVLKLGALLGAGGVVAPGLAACAAPPRATAPDGSPGLAGSVTVLAIGGDPYADPVVRKVYEDFRTEHPGIEWDIRPLPGGGPEWDRLARAALASGEP